MSDALRTEALQMHGCGYTYKEICAELEIGQGQLSGWVQRSKQPKRPRKYLVSHIREVLTDLDAEVPINEIQRQTGVNKETIRRWRDNPKYRAATFEYDDEFDYDADDLTDCSVVAQMLCRTTIDLSERLEFMMAAAGVNVNVQDDNSVGFKPRHTTRKRQGAKTRA